MMDLTSAGRPGPAMAGVHPAAVVTGRKAPGFIVDPGPAPGPDPAPVAEPIRCPVDHDDLRHPHGAIVRIHDPIAIAVQLFIADDFARHVARGMRIVFAPIAIFSPQVQSVGGPCRGEPDWGIIAGVQPGALIAAHQLRAASISDFGAPAPHGQLGALVPVIDVKTIAALLQYGNIALRRLDLETLLAVEIADPYADGTCSQTQAHALVVHGQELQGRA